MAADQGKDHWRQLEELFYATLDLLPQDRAGFLDRACAGDTSLRQEVESLLASSEKTMGFLQRPVEKAAANLSGGAALTGERIGRYRILRQLGEGGMGAVYLAERADDVYHQRVALKIMHGGLGRSREMLLRFSGERQILANLNHPNIARLLDGGIAPDGSPYLVMEFIDGIAVDEYVLAHKLPIQDRLQLFRTICGAVVYAHRNLVVHRDIKPANILVTSEGIPKLLDFGIAKLLQSSDRDNDVALTRATERLMTPEYASPEQARGEPVTTTTDVYALGTLLYQLLTGRPPFKIATRNPAEVARIICEQMPTKPSTALRSGPAPLHADVSTLRGDLDNIILKALRKEAERRYSSVEALAEDVRRYLEGYPVDAGSDAWTYRAGKFIRRHRIAVAAASFMAIAILGFSIGMGILAERARRERMKTEREAQFLSSIFQAATPDVARGKPVMVRDLLDQGAKRIDEELKSEPEVQAAMLDSIGRSYFALGAYEQATPLLERAHSLRQQTLGKDHTDVAATANVLGSLWEMRGEYRKAESFFRESLSINKRARGEHDPVTVGDIENLGEVLYYQDRDAEAEPLLRQAIADSNAEAQAGLAARNYLALLLERKDAFEEAAKLLREAADATKKLEGADSINYATSLHNLAGALADNGDLPAAVKTEKDVLEIRRKVSGEHHPDLIYSLNNLGWFLLEEGDWASAAPYLRDGLELARQSLGPRHPRTVTALNNWARVLQGKGDFAAAEKTYQQALKVLTETNASNSWSGAKIISNLGLLQLDRGDYAGAERYAREAMDLRSQLGGDANPEVASSLIDVGMARLLQRDAAGAKPLLQRAFDLRAKTLPADHPKVVAAEVRLAMALMAEGKPSAAEPIARMAVEAVHSARHPWLAWQIAEAESVLGTCLKIEGHAAESEQYLRGAEAGLKSHPQVPFRQQPFPALRIS